MTFLTRLASGNIALWRAFWLMGTPFALLWDASGLCILTGYGVGEPTVAALLALVFSLACIGLMVASVGVWRSATNYPRGAWWRSAFAIGAKISAVVSGLAATASFITVLYLLAGFIYAAFL